MAETSSEQCRPASLGSPRLPSPLRSTAGTGGQSSPGYFVADDDLLRSRLLVGSSSTDRGEPLFEKAGPRQRIFFDPAQTCAAIITCGGLCPGLNNVIRSAVLELHHNYGVRRILGIPYGYRGLDSEAGLEPVTLDPQTVENINQRGGTILGTSRGRQEAATMVDTLQHLGVNILMCIGGDGTQRGAHAIYEEVTRRGASIAVVGIPKTIDNDIEYCQPTFGFHTAVDAAREVLVSAHNEARSALNGVGLVKLMGRDSGFIAAGATLASQDVNFTLIPEVEFQLEGAGGLLQALHTRLSQRRHAVIVVAEGAGQHLFADHTAETDASGNRRYHDIGLYLRQQITEDFKRRKVPIDLKYIDPSYIIRSVPANCHDSLLCDQLARRAVHAGMAGKTDVLIGYWNHAFMHVPMDRVTQGKKRIDPAGELWTCVLATTGQPARLSS